MSLRIDKIVPGNVVFHDHPPSDVILVDTKANILAETPDTGKIGYATDVERFYVYDGTNWQESAVQFSVREQEPNMGYEQNESGQGYGSDYITDKRLSHVLIGSNDREENGAIRVDVSQDPDTFEIYLRSAWQTIIYDLTTSYGDFRHTPLSEQIYIWKGSSVLLGLNGRPIINEYTADMGCYPAPRILNGGEF